MDLTDPQLVITLVSHVSQGGKIAAFAAEHGVSRATVSREIGKRPELKDKLAVARSTAKKRAHHMGRMMPAGTPSADIPGLLVSGLPSDQAFEAWLWATAQDSEHRASAKCAGIIAELKYGGQIIAARKRAEREGIEETGTRTRRVVNVDLPEPGSRRVIDAEVVET